MKLAFPLFILLLINNCSAQIPYGNNPQAGKFVRINGVKLYYEKYGSGPPLFVIHGNRSATPGNTPQIEYFSKKYTVYSIDCRGRGKSESGKDSLTFMNIAKDFAEFINEMKLDSVYIIGKSDGAIIALLMAIYYPEHISKIAAFAPNLWPDSTALFPEAVNSIHQERVKAEKMLALHDTSADWKIEIERYRLDEFQPDITKEELQKITIPVLVMSADRDVIKPEHILFIYQNIKYSNLSIFTGERHKVSRENPLLFNTTIDKYFSEPYKPNSFRFE
jgi:pimeloyl-ACP methyl ester carboxylesterase